MQKLGSARTGNWLKQILKEKDEDHGIFDYF